jgi:prepilin-type processing-associated H-X9-DG protein
LRRPGATLLELLVSVAILATLFGLLLPAVNNIRARADLAKCQNNLRQLGLALHGYAATAGRLPSGTESGAEANKHPFVTWLAHLLPELEQAELWRQIEAAYRTDRNFVHIGVHVHRRTPQPGFVCPSDPRGPVSTRTDILPTHVGLTSYLGVEGTDRSRADGVLFLDSRTTYSSVTDGLSSTLLVGERPTSASQRFGWWYAGWGFQKDGTADSTLGVQCVNDTLRRCPRSVPPYRRGDLDTECDTLHFWSFHSGGANFVLADGSVRLLTYDMAPAVLVALSTRAGGEPDTGH